ncbi:TetR/AcrR family transcriptional regulator [Rhodococcus ruber]|uniref:TetR/AcrR family transcriptional regulator n=1 Tax=Rhodococcus ruber TaxID=1830 RepID=A0ABT4MED8_9NOCA|nr:TetR/AcrR family transcriptional regulator [Rhodococcus ruber]MCZ4519353.1 TetR/AcrR family transcriptional regulator [Rhodococcus ruber]
MSPGKPTGAAVFSSTVTHSIVEAVLDEFSEAGYGRLSMERVAKRARVGKSALYRRWPSKEEMVIAVLSEFSVGVSEAPDTGTFRGDLRATLGQFVDWIDDPRFSKILPDLVAESARNHRLGELHTQMIGTPRRERAVQIFERAVARGELPEDMDVELALDLVAGPLYWRSTVRGADVDSAYLDHLTDVIVAALTGSRGLRPTPTPVIEPL